MLVIDESTIFCTDPEGFPGLQPVADLVMEDVSLVTGARPDCVDIQEAAGKVVYFGTLGESRWLDMLNARDDFDFKEVRGKREVFGFWTVENPSRGISEALIIVGSDRLGTIYGLFHLSEILGVSPLVRSFGVLPRRRPRVELGPWVNYAAAAPSAMLRGLSVPGPLDKDTAWTLLERLLRQRGNLLEVRVDEGKGSASAKDAVPAEVLKWAEECGVCVKVSDAAEESLNETADAQGPSCCDGLTMVRIDTDLASHLPELWSRMTGTLEKGPEVGFLLEVGLDLMPEPGISFFLDLASDKKKLGGRDASVTARYTWEWLKRQFGAAFQAKELSRLDQMLKEYTKLAERWRPEGICSAKADPAAERNALWGPETAAELRRESDRCKLVLELARTIRNTLAEEDASATAAFGRLIEEPVTSAVSGIASLLEEASGRVLPHRVILSRSETDAYIWTDALRPDVGSIPFEIAGPEGEEFSFRIQSGCPWIRFSVTEGKSSSPVRIVAALDRSGLSGRSEGVFVVSDASGNAVTVQIPVYCPAPSDESDCFWENDSAVSVDASHFSRAIPSGNSVLEILAPFGPLGSAIKAFPASADYSEQPLHSLPCAEYEFYTKEAGPRKVRFLLSSQCDGDRIGFSLGRGPVQVASEAVFDHICGIRAVEASFDCPAGRNLLRVYALTPGTVLLRILIRKAEAPVPLTCAGPAESYFHRSSDLG